MTRDVQATFYHLSLLRHFIQRLGLLGINMEVLDLYSRYDAPKRISNSRSSYFFTKKSNAGVNTTSTHSKNTTD